jgi:hypothetical protein
MKLIIVVFLVLVANTSWGWSEHHLITAEALTNSNFKSKTVVATPFQEMAQALGYKDALDFNEKIQIKKEFIFEFKLGENSLVPVNVVDILAEYSDEPDWNMDKELFSTNEYPALWRPEYEYMGNKTGTPSQSFRHMFWGGASFPHLITTFKYPSPFSDIGEAPTRATLFIDLARRAKQKGFDYWSVRFIANALHYLEDVSQPYHSTQVQTKDFLLMPYYLRYYFSASDYFNNATSNYVAKVSHIVAYYHFAFENYVAYVMLNADNQNTAQADIFLKALTGAGTRKALYPNADIGSLVKAMSLYSAVLAPNAAYASMDFFPDFKNYLQRNKVHLDSFNPTLFMDQNWWQAVVKNGQTDASTKTKYFNIVTTVFTQLGANVRAVVNQELQ